MGDIYETMSVASRNMTGLLPFSRQLVKHYLRRTFANLPMLAKQGAFGQPLAGAMATQPNSVNKKALTPERGQGVLVYVRWWSDMFVMLSYLYKMENGDGTLFSPSPLKVEELPPLVRGCVERLIFSEAPQVDFESIVEEARKARFDINWYFGSKIPWSVTWYAVSIGMLDEYIEKPIPQNDSEWTHDWVFDSADSTP